MARFFIGELIVNTNNGIRNTGSKEGVSWLLVGEERAGIDQCGEVTCTNGDQCNDAGACDPLTGACGAPSPVTDGAVCDDGNSGTTNDICTAGTCEGGVAVPGSSNAAVALQLLLTLLVSWWALGRYRQRQRVGPRQG